MDKIEVNNLYKVFGKKPQKAIRLLEKGYSKEEVFRETGLTVGVNNANFEINSKEIFVIMGLSGSGKSTLLRCLNRLVEPTAGEVRLDGVSLTDLSKEELREIRKDKFGMVFQNFGLLPNRTILENTEFGLEIQDIPKDKRVVIAKDALERVGLAGWEDQYPDQLSGGMQQRVGLARALAIDPDILLMDEPFSALDPLIKRDMQDRLLELYEELDKTIIFITHDLDEALKLGDRIAIMKDGDIIQIGTPEEILNNAENDYIREFVQGVNRSKVLTAQDIMVKPLALLYENNGPKTAMHKMKEEGISSIFVVGEHREFKGVVRGEDALKAVNNSEDNLANLIKETKVASPEESIDELFSDIAGLNTPLPVVDDNDRLLGIIVKSTVLANLAGEEII
ncbi:glycine betaine/proline transport system ATP-binding protein [Orenia metallireducens]|uniref:Quaternary amine transport ATP-binding protein n=1 Tax=Orenia metallireducens TaxID=1413210 RepID=A0A285HH11_9FIRM|nr:glycine betaine/L-proline ABC transporter ATP-binding protein [Orenia metallireducens]PRX27153.1 glycine betaine/proline transport system ATP-binding protein [Orenia metallireducens]SNY34978.1 glycine betaine/proline transport system ATP-binding protein [Orenia metallireducens]